jgi:tetratricopeptide (TPR) repeat protein
MQREFTCSCGKVILVSESKVGELAFCGCGRAVRVPLPRTDQTHAITSGEPPALPTYRPPEETERGDNGPVEVIRPVQGFLRAAEDRPINAVPVMIGLTLEAIWVQATWQTRAIPLKNLAIERLPTGTEIMLTLGAEVSAEKLVLTFINAAEAERWCNEISPRLELLTGSTVADVRHTPDGVALVRRAPDVPHIVVGRVDFAGYTCWAADRGLQLRAAALGADAVFELNRQRCTEMGWNARHVSGVAVHVEGADARRRLRLRWYAEEVGAVVNRMLLLLAIQMALLFLASVVCAGTSILSVPTGETPSEVLASSLLWLGVFYTWPVLLLALLQVLRWPQLLRIAGLAVLAMTTGRAVTVWLAHFAAIRTSGVGLHEGKIWIMLDPVEWALVIAGAVLCARAWRLSNEAPQILPEETQAVPAWHTNWARGLLAATGVFAIAFLAFAGTSRYQMSAYVLQPGVDVKSEQEALRVLNDGVGLAAKGDIASAERSFRRALEQWEILAARPKAPPHYRASLATALHNLGWTREQQGRPDEAEGYYARAVTIADELAGERYVDAQFTQTMAFVRQAVAELGRSKSSKALDEKDRTAGDKYEEAQVLAEKNDHAAESLYLEAIALWEEVLPQATNEAYRKSAPARLAEAHLILAEFQQWLGKRDAAEATLKKAIDYGEKAVAQEPNRPLPKHHLATARGMLQRLGDQDLADDIAKLFMVGRFADAADRWLQSVRQAEDQVHEGRDREVAVRRLAFRLDRYAWFLAHCPDERVKETRGAVKLARRATELQPDVGDYRFTLAMVQYRNDNWRDSLASLEKLKAQERGLDASGWFVSAMDLHQLGQKEDARAALRKGVEWIEERQRQAERDAMLRFQDELARPAVEALQREAENVLEVQQTAMDKKSSATRTPTSATSGCSYWTRNIACRGQ